jgi:CRISPR-associated protein Csb1
MLDRLLAGVAVGGEVGALRITATYQPTGGSGAKVFPPTYPGEKKGESKYLLEIRYLDGSATETVLIDSVQSQANRLEEALVDAIDGGLVRLPFIETAADIGGIAFRVTTLDAPHRSPDAYFRDSETAGGTAFDDSEVGQALRAADERNARALYRHSPADLVLGVWDSQRGGRGLRLPRAYTSEMIGLSPQAGMRAAGRLDPFNIPTTEVHYADGDPSVWSLDSGSLPKSVKSKKGKTSNVNHGNALASDAPGGFAVSEVHRTAVLSLKVLRRLRFPDAGEISPAADVAARAVLAAIAIVGDRVAFADSTLFLRSGCDLAVESEHAEWIGRNGSERVAVPSVSEAVGLFGDAVAHAESLGLSFADPVHLVPKANLRKLLEQTFTTPAAEDEE